MFLNKKQLYILFYQCDFIFVIFLDTNKAIQVDFPKFVLSQLYGIQNR